MPDQHITTILRHQEQIDHYCRMLAPNLSEIERQFIHNRIAHERTAMERLIHLAQSRDATADGNTVIAAKALRSRNYSEA